MPRVNNYLPSLLALILLAIIGSGCTKELRKNRHLARAQIEFESLHYDRAEIEYFKVLEIAPLDPIAISHLGLIYQDEGRLARAHAFLLKASELEPQNLDVLTKLSLNCLALGDLKKASESALSVLAKRPGQPEALEALARSALTPKAMEDTRDQIEKLRKADQDKPGYHLALGTLDIRRQDATNAEIQFRKALELDAKSTSALGALGGLYLARNDLTNASSMLKSASDLSPVRSATRLVYAEFRFVTGNAAEAKRLLEEITSQAPDYLPAWTTLAQIAFREKNYDVCQSLLQKVLARDPSNFDALMLNGNIRLAKGQTAEALAGFNQVISLYGPMPQVQLQLARAQLLNNEPNKAITSLNKAVDTNPNFAEAVLLLATLNIRKGNVSQAVSSLTELLKRQPQIPQCYLLLANAYLQEKQPDLAVETCNRMQKRFPASPEVPFILGSVLVQQHRAVEARQAFEKSIELSPNYLPALEEIVNLDLADKKYEPALARVKKQIERQPDSGTAWLLLAKIYIARAETQLVDANHGNGLNTAKPKLRLGDVPAAQPDIGQAETALLKSIELDPALRNSYLVLAQLYVSCNKQQQALDRLNGFLAKTNDVAASMQVGMIQDSLKNYSAAREAYNKAIAINPNFSLALNNLAYLYSEHFGDLSKAYQLAEKARQLLPDDPFTADTLGWILYKRGEFSRALGIIEESALKLPTEPEIQLHLGLAHYMVGEEEAASVALRKASEAAKDFPGKAEAQRKLTILAIDAKKANAATLDSLEHYLKETPGDPIALCRLGEIQARDGALKKAAQSFEGALKYSPQNPQILVRLAQLYAGSSLRDAKKALELAKEAHSLASDDPQVSSVLGGLVYEAGDFRWAASLLEDSARKLPEDPQVAYNLGLAYYCLGRVTDAETLMGKVVGGNSASLSTQAGSFIALVGATHDESKVEGNSATAEKILKEDPTYLPALMISALVQQHRGNFKQAGMIYDQIIDRYPAFSPALRNLAILCWEHLGDEPRAYSLAVKAREGSHQDPELARLLGILEYRKANYARSVQLLKECVGSRKDDGELFYYLGMSQHQLKAERECKTALQQALTLNLQLEFATNAKRVLAELK